MKKETREFYKKDIEYNKFFEKKKKISFDINDNLLKLIDEVSKLTGNNRTVILNALISEGVSPFFKTMENVWKGYLEDYKDKWDEGMKKNMRKLIEDLKKLKESYPLG